ncbi:hypothetical protein N7470_004406 [Penicillium chermesinum]|nr:hypothetical protein N7470_004406 [Penicillium chermesinum]
MQAEAPSFLPFSSRQSLEDSPVGHQPEASSHFGNIPISIRGIVLVAIDDLPTQYRSLFPFPLFNAVQSKCFQTAYGSNDNLVLSAPTGSGKTVIMELAICRLLSILKDERFKVVYQAPTKSLCAERFRDWNAKFSSLNLKCAELTGDTDHTHIRSVQNSQIIITTPEKWDSMTRKWKDHMRLMQLVKLFLIDEVHILKESRGATLEAVVSRMKNIGSNVRFVALSATVPNSEDVATWLGKDATNQHVPAHREHFGEEFRPVKLQKFVYGYQSMVNDFAFDKICGSKLPEIIEVHSCQKPIMIFCCTRNSSVATAKELARIWELTNPPARLWKGPDRYFEVHSDDLKTTIAAGVAFHHAGLGPSDRHTIEKGFLDGHIHVICCTSTLAVGVNLPCHLVIIKNTVGWQEGGCKEYSDFEMMQMLGRAGRPQFDDSATAVILTRKHRVDHYEKLVSGTESLESCLHLNLIEHLNAEIGLGNVSDVETATKWLAGTFLFVRLRRNPTHYKLKEGASEEDEDELLRHICEKDIALLRECGLVEAEALRSTQFGEAMARYYVRFDTMRILLSLEDKATVYQILDAIVQAEEFKEIRLKVGEKSLFKEINRDQAIRYPIKVDIALPAHKISLLLQSELGAADFPSGDQFQKHKFSIQQDKNLVFSHVSRLIRCVIDCQIARGDSVSIANALELARSFGAKVWDRSPLQMKQIEQVGVVAVRKLAASGITSMEDLEDAEPHLIEMTLSKNPPFGTKLLARLKEFPKLRVNLKIMGKITAKDARTGRVKIPFQFEVATMNDKMPSHFQRRPIYVCCLTETSDGRLIDFRRISSNKLHESLRVDLVAELAGPDQYIKCHLALQGKQKSSPTFRDSSLPSASVNKNPAPASNLTTPASAEGKFQETPQTRKEIDIFDGDELDLDDFLTAGPQNERNEKQQFAKGFQKGDDDFDWFSLDDTPPPHTRTLYHQSTKTRGKSKEWIKGMGTQDHEEDEPKRLANGNWACNHRCNDKARVGLEKRPRPPKRKATTTEKADGLNQLTIPLAVSKTNSTADSKKSKMKDQGIRELVEELPTSKQVQDKSKQPMGGDRTTATTVEKGRQPPSFGIFSSDYGDDDFSDFSLPHKPSSSSFNLPRATNLSQTKLDEPSPTALVSGKSSSKEAAHENQIFNNNSPIVISSDSPPGTGNEIFTNSEQLHSAATPATQLVSLSTNLPLSARRSPSGIESMISEHFPKCADEIITRQESMECEREFDIEAFLHDCTNYPSTSSNLGTPGWEDIDRMLLEEFKDVVDFH